MHAISSYRGNIDTARPPQTHRQDRLQYSAQCSEIHTDKNQYMHQSDSNVM